jgi:hypothetical protein
MPGRAVLAILGVGLMLSACGAGPSTTSTKTPPPIPAVGLTIDSPEGGAVTATKEEGALVADVRMRGHAQPGAFVRVSSGCAEPGCELSAPVDDSGRWSVTVRAQAPTGKPYARLFAQLAAESSITLVKLKEPGTRAARAKARKARRARELAAQREQASRGGGAAAPSTTTAPAAPPLPEIPNATPDPTPAPTPGTATGNSVLLIGDSLGLGIQPYLSGLLPGWSVTSDSRTGRPLAEGMSRWRAERGSAAVSAFSLFTNDAPTNTSALEAAVRESASGGCAVWATIVRPPQGGTSYKAANQVLERLAQELPGRVVVVPWAATVAATPGLVGSDGVHATTQGYQQRAQLYAQAIQSCL